MKGIIVVIATLAAGLAWYLGSGGSGDPSVQGSVPVDRSLDAGPGIARVVTVEQNWSSAEAAEFYNTPQGSKIMPYAWFLHLERSTSKALFRNNAHMRELGFLPRRPDDAGNPDGLPIGFVPDPAPTGRLSLGLTCAGCHTAQINFGDTAYLIDGGPSLGDLETFLARLVSAMQATNDDESKFDRFAKRVLGDAAEPSELGELRSEFRAVLTERKAYNDRNMPKGAEGHYGFGRIDAFGAIMNEVTVRFLQVADNVRPANAPVSYPFLWDTPQHDRVQWNGAAENETVAIADPIVGTRHVGALGRNIGEVLGVFGSTDPTRPSAITRSYPSTVNRKNLIRLEKVLTSLWSPEWPLELDEAQRAQRTRGAEVYTEAGCHGCHGKPSSFDRTSPTRTVTARMRATGTDPGMYTNVLTRMAKTGVVRRRIKTFNPLDRFRAEASFKDIIGHMVLRTMLGRRVGPERALTPEEESAVSLRFAPVVTGFRVKGVGTLLGDFRDTAFDPQTKQFSFASDSQFKLVHDISGKSKSSSPSVLDVLPHDFDARKWLAEHAGSGSEAMGFEAAIKSLVPRKSVFQVAPFQVGLPVRFTGEVDTPQSLKNVAWVRFTELSTRHEEKDEGATPLRRLELADAQVHAVYKARPLNGIWATAPFLHNGSVPNLTEMLTPPADRTKTFFVGSREYDSVNVGLKSDSGPFEFDTSKTGNSNGGHPFGTGLSAKDKLALIEYLRSL